MGRMPFSSLGGRELRSEDEDRPSVIIERRYRFSNVAADRNTIKMTSALRGTRVLDVRGPRAIFFLVRIFLVSEKGEESNGEKKKGEDEGATKRILGVRETRQKERGTEDFALYTQKTLCPPIYFYCVVVVLLLPLLCESFAPDKVPSFFLERVVCNRHPTTV